MEKLHMVVYGFCKIDFASLAIKGNVSYGTSNNFMRKG